MIFRRRDSETARHEAQPGGSQLYERLRKYGSRGIVVVHSAEGQPVSPEAAANLVPAEGGETTMSETSRESALYERLRKYGSRGIIVVHGAEGQPISPEAAQYLRPAG